MTVARQLSRLRCRAASASMAAVPHRRRCTPPTLSTGRAIRALRSTRGSDAGPAPRARAACSARWPLRGGGEAAPAPHRCCTDAQRALHPQTRSAGIRRTPPRRMQKTGVNFTRAPASSPAASTTAGGGTPPVRPPSNGPTRARRWHVPPSGTRRRVRRRRHPSVTDGGLGGRAARQQPGALRTPPRCHRPTLLPASP